MPEEFEDTGELLEQLREHQRLTGTEPRDEESNGMTRRDLLVRGGVAAAAVSGVGALAGRAAAAPSKTGAFTGTLNVISLGVEFPTAEVAQRIKQDLGFSVNVTGTDPVTEAQKMITAPETFDIFGGYNYQDIQGWSTHHLMPIDTHKIAAWPQLYKLFAWGKVRPGSKSQTYGDGDAPFRALFLKQGTKGLPLTKEAPRSNKDIVQWVVNEATGKTRGPMPRYVVGTPAHFNADSIGYNADVIKKLPTQVGWEYLLNKTYKGRVALLKDPGIVMQDIGNALKAQGVFKPKDMGNMTQAEIDRVVKIATTYKKAGQFRAYWANFNESVNLMASKEVVVESMWSPAVAQLVAQGINVKYAAPPTGFRGWCSANGIAAHVASRSRQAGGLLRLPELDVQRVAGRLDHAPGLLHRQRRHAAQLDQEEPAGDLRRHCVQARRVRVLVRRRPCYARPPGNHGQGRRHQEGFRPRRRLLQPAHRPLLVLELVLHEQCVPDQAVERLPQRLRTG